MMSSAKSVTSRQSSGTTYYPDELLNALRLEGAEYKPAESTSGKGLTTFTLGDGKWDPSSGGGVGLKSIFTLDSSNCLRTLSIDYLSIEPSGRAVTRKLLRLETSSQGDKLRLKSLSLLDHDIKLNNAELVGRVFGAVQRFHADMRDMNFPEVAKILSKDFKLQEINGVPLNLPGLSPAGGFNFEIPDGKFHRGTVEIPHPFIAEMIGTGSNDLDPSRDFDKTKRRIGFDRQNSDSFVYQSALNLEGQNGALTAETLPRNTKTGFAIPDLIKVSWSPSPDHKDCVKIDQLTLLGDSGEGRPPSDLPRRLGIVNAANHDLRRGHYPALPDHIAAFDQHYLIDNHAFSAKIDRFPQMMVHVMGGRNPTELMPGLGGTIGGNCNDILFHWRDPQGRLRCDGVRIDDGVTFNRSKNINGGEHGFFDRAMSDTTANDPFVKHIFITHLHADHMQKIIDAARCDILADKTVHLAEYDARVLEVTLKEAGIPETQWPKLNRLKDEGWIHGDVDGQRIWSVRYSTNNVRHSTDVTSFQVVPAPYLADSQGQPLNGKIETNPHYWSYVSLGDMRFDKADLPHYTGPKPFGAGFKCDFFSGFKSTLREEYPHIPTAMTPKVDRIGFVEIEGTSPHHEGWSNSFENAVNNWVRLHNWFPDLGMRAYVISTSKLTMEHLMMVGNITQRNLTGEGAYVEKRLRDMGIKGFTNYIDFDEDDRGRKQAFLNWHAEQIGVEPVKFIGRTSNAWHELKKTAIHTTLDIASGSQGTAIEQRSVGTQDADGWGRHDLDPKYTRQAYGIDKRKILHIYAQGAIPGNEEEQLAQARKLAFQNDCMVAVEVHKGTRFFNVKEPYLSNIKADLDRHGESYTAEPANGLFLHGFSVYLSGHGKKEDLRQGFFPWFKENNVGMIGVQHYQRFEAPLAIHGIADEFEIPHPTEAIPNNVIFTLAGGRDFTIVGKTTPSFILARDNRRADKCFDGTTFYKRVTFHIGEHGMSNGGLYANETNQTYFRDFGTTPYEKPMQEILTVEPIRSRREWDAAMMRLPFDPRRSEFMPTSGIRPPRPIPVYDHLLAAGVF